MWQFSIICLLKWHTEYYLCGVLAKMHNQNQEEANKLYLRDKVQNNWPVLFKNVKVIKESIKNCFRKKESKRQDNLMKHNSGLDTGPDIGHD